MLKNLFQFSFILMLLISGNLQAQTPLLKDMGLPVGKQLPALSVIDTNGEKQSLKQLSASKGLILVLFRSADWCPFCKKHLVELNQWNDKFKQLGYSIAGISYDSTETLKQFSAEKQLKYPLLSDQANKTFKDYKVLNQDYQPGSKHYGIPYPGIMVISPQGKLEYKYFYQGYKKRVNVEMLYNQLRR